MQVTKYPQSCLVVEVDGSRLLVDPGNFAMNRHEAADFGRLDAVLYTHRHGDHFDTRLLESVAERGVRFVVNADVAALLDGYDVTVLEDGDEAEVAGVRVQAYDLPHCLMVDGSPGPPNTGFVIDGSLLHPGDGVDVPVMVSNLAVPIAGPSISFRDAYRMVERAGASKVIPIHYDAYVANPDQFGSTCDLAEVIVLADGQTATL